MNQEIGSAAGIIWRVLHDKGEMSMAALKKSVSGAAAKDPILDWAIGWLARENKLLFRKDRKILKISLQPE